jgi:hypothetical protein
MGFVLHLSLANGADAEGWTQQEISEYDGWGHDSSRRWRKAPQLQKESAFPLSEICDMTLYNNRRGFRTSLLSLGRQRASRSPSPPPLLSNEISSLTIYSHRFTLHHRFYFHTDGRGRLWLAAEDGCEGVGPVLHQG